MTMRFLIVAALATIMTLVPSSSQAGDHDTVTGLVVNRRGVPLRDVHVRLGDHLTVTGVDGRFRFERVATGTVTFERVGYTPAAIEWAGEADWLGVTLTPRIVRSIHVTGTKPATNTGFQEMLDIATATSVNSLMLDIKSESGLVFHQTEVGTVATVGSAYANPWDLAERAEQAHELGLYVIVRIVTFEDPIAARSQPSWAVTTSDESLLVHSDQYWLDPTDLSAQQYALDLAVEACSLGVDEVQFDYVRFPTGDKTTLRFDGPADASARQSTITGFLREARALLQPMGCATAADIFGFITNKSHEGGIGQQLEDLAATVDVISPMIYPSHYAAGWYGFGVPNDHPGPVVHNASQDALARMSHSPAILRPWLQDFWYTASQVTTQITTVDALDLGWMLWNVSSDFTVPGIPVDRALHAPETAPAPDLVVRPTSGFFDVPDTHPHTDPVGWAGSTAITQGCNAPWGDFFCPHNAVTRGQMAAFLVRAFGLALVNSRNTFGDDEGSVFEPDIEAVATAGITLGCAPDRFCPSDTVSRGQMASFLARALGLAPVAAPERFVDDDGSVHESSIAALAEVGIALGCSADSFCPEDSLTRSHLAVFLHRALAP